MFLILCSPATKAQSDEHKLKHAILEREYYALNAPDANVDSLYFEQAENLISLSNYELAISKLNRINLSSLPKTFRNEVINKLTIAYYMNSDYNNALRNAKSLYYTNLGDSLIMHDATLLQLLCLNNLQKWEEAKQMIENDKLFFYPSNSTEALFSVYNEIPKLKKPERAQLLSHIIPGSGQIYSGAIGEGLFNFTLQASILALSGYGIYQQYYLTSYFSGLGLFQKFYFGGGERAMFLAEKYNEEKAKAYNKRVNALLLNP